MFETILYKQIDSFMENKFSPFLCSFGKNQKALLAFENDWKLEIQIDNGEKVGVIFMDLSKCFETINHSLLLAKLKAYDFSDEAKFISRFSSRSTSISDIFEWYFSVYLEMSIM